MRTAAAVLFLLAGSTPAFALQGRIVNAQGQPIAGAEVTILGLPGRAMTDDDGTFSWTPDPSPPFEVLVVAAGGVYMKPILVDKLTDGRLELTVQPLVNEVVTVSGSAGSIESAPAAGTATLTAMEIQTRGPANLIQALENVAGVSQVSEGQAAVPAIRGLARGRTLILIDGARVTSERRVGPSATYLDPDVIEGVEVARGPGSVAYGSDAFGGVISVRTRNVIPGSGFGFRVSGTLGTGVPDRRAAVEVSHGLPRGGVLFTAHARQADDYEGPEAVVLNSGYSDRGFLGRVTHQWGEGLFSAGWQGDFGRDIERPRNNAHIVRFYYPSEDSHRLTAAYDLPAVRGGFTRLSFTGFLGSYAQVTNQDRFATATTGRTIESGEVAARDFHVRALAERPAGAARFEFGVDINGRFGLHTTDVLELYPRGGATPARTEYISVESARRADYGVYASVDAAVMPRLTLAGGLRGDIVTTKNEGGFFGDRSTSNGAGSGFAALTAGSFGGFSATVQVARGFRDPVLSDRYFRGPTGRGFITGEPALAPETSQQIDAGLRFTSRRFRGAAYLYQYRINALIERYEAQSDFFFFRNRGRARLRGFELEAQGDLGRGVTIESAFQVARGVALDDQAFLDDVTPETGSVQVRKNFAARGFAQVRAAMFARDERPGPTERVVPGYTLLDAGAGVTVFRGFELRVMLRNLLNDDYLASQDARAVPAPGRSASLSAVVRFGQ